MESGALYVEARRFILSKLADDDLHRSRELIDAFEPDPEGRRLVFEPGSHLDINDLALTLARRAAAIEALGLLFADGIVAEVNPYDPNGCRGPSARSCDLGELRTESRAGRRGFNRPPLGRAHALIWRMGANLHVSHAYGRGESAPPND